jgi:hypothetical protein
MHGGFRYESRNQEGEDVLSFTLSYDLIIVNTIFRKRVSHLVTFSSGKHCSQIDFILTRREDRHTCFFVFQFFIAFSPFFLFVFFIVLTFPHLFHICFCLCFGVLVGLISSLPQLAWD